MQDVAQVALGAGSSPRTVFQHYRELVRKKEAKEWLGVEPVKAADATAMPVAVA